VDKVMLLLDGKAVAITDYQKSLAALNIKENSHQLSSKAINYKSIVFCQKASGAWNCNIYSFIKFENEKSLKDA
jgi:hypothetical protein